MAKYTNKIYEKFYTYQHDDIYDKNIRSKYIESLLVY